MAGARSQKSKYLKMNRRNYRISPRIPSYYSLYVKVLAALYGNIQRPSSLNAYNIIIGVASDMFRAVAILCHSPGMPETSAESHISGVCVNRGNAFFIKRMALLLEKQEAVYA